MLDPILSLAIAMQSDPGVYALLVGSGLSRSAGIPTGWEVVLDLIRKLALLMNEDCGRRPMTGTERSLEKNPTTLGYLTKLQTRLPSDSNYCAATSNPTRLNVKKESKCRPQRIMQ